MKVLYILHSTIMGGATISFLNMLFGLKEKGVEPYIVIPKHDDAFEKKVQVIGSDIFEVPVIVSWIKNNNDSGENLFFSKIRFLETFIYLWRTKRCSAKSLEEVIKKVSPDIIHTNTGVVHEGFWIAKKNKIPHVWHLREYQDKDFNCHIYPTKRLFECYLKHSYVITITDAICRHFHLESYTNACTIYNGILGENETSLVFPKKKYFLCASRVSPEKGHNETIASFAEFYKRHKDYKLVILGFGSEPYIEQLKLQADALGCSEAIVWTGYKDDVKPYMREAKALIVASYFEGFGRMTAEASFMGCMVIGRDTGGTKEILDKTGGMKFTTSHELIMKMEEVVNISDATYKQIVTQAQHVAVDMFSNEANVENIYNLYTKLLC